MSLAESVQAEIDALYRVPATTSRQYLARLYRLAAELEVAIGRAEATVEHERDLNGGRLASESIPHGDESAYRRHLRKDIPFPEDDGGAPCGCRYAHARAEQIRVKRSLTREQLTIFDALRESSC